MSNKFAIFSRNGEILPIDQATVSVFNLEYSYGFGVYETIKVRNNIVYFLPQHVERLLTSAQYIGLQHQLTEANVAKFIRELVNALQSESYNLKVLLIGAPTPAAAQLYILPLAPLFPDRKLYQQGAKLISAVYERWMPQAKSLNMLGSYYYYTVAKQQGCYDALLVNRAGCITEGTRTNIYMLKDKTIISPPQTDILMGVTQLTLIKVAQHHNYNFIYQPIRLEALRTYGGMFLSSTSSKIMPVRKVDQYEYPTIAPSLKELMRIYDTTLTACKGNFAHLITSAQIPS